MDSSERSQDEAKSLREQAKRKVRGMGAPLTAMSEADIAAMVHELQVHQVELEMQNEELRRTQADLEESRTKYTDLFDFAPVGYVVLSPEGLILEANLTAATLLQKERSRLLRKSFTTYVMPASRDTFRLHYASVFKTAQPQECQIELRPQDGKDPVVVRLRSEPVPRGAGAVVQCRTTITNVTDVARAEQRLKDSERRFRTLAENSPDIIVRIDRHMRVVYVNKAVEEALGMTPEEIVGRTPEEVGAPEDLVEYWKETIQRTFRTGKPDRIDFDYPAPDRIRRYSASGVPEFEEHGTLDTILVTIRDVTERVLAEEKYSAVIHSLQDGFCIIDRQGRYLEANEGYSRMLGVDREEILHLAVWDVLKPEVHRELADHVQKALGQGWDKFPLVHVRKDGSVVDCDVTLQKLNGDRLFVFARDVTEQHRAERQRVETLRRLQFVAQATDDGIWDWDVKNDKLWYNEAYLTSFGYPPDEQGVSVEWWKERIHPDDREAAVATLLGAVRNGTDRWTSRYRFRRQDGSYAWVIARAYVLRDDEGNATRMVGSMLDMTEKLDLLDQLEQERSNLEKRVRERTAELDTTVDTLQQQVAETIEVQDRLAHQNEMLQKIIDNVPVMVCFFNAAGRIDLVNDEFTRVLGYSTEDLQEQGLMALAGPDGEDRRVFREHMMTQEPWWHDFSVQTKDGVPVLSSWATAGLPDGSYVGIGIDIRQRRDFEDRIRESEERYRTLVELSPDAILVEREGIIQFVNTTAVKLLGAQIREDLIGRSMLELIPPEHRPRAERQFKYLRRRRPLPPSEERILRLDATPVDVELAAIPILFEGQAANQIVLRDITQRKQVETRLQENAQQLQQQAELLNLAHDSIVVNDMEGRVVFWNPGAEQTYGWTRDEAIGKISHDLLKTRFPANLIEITARLLSQGRWDGELTHTTKTGQTIIVSSRWALQRNEDSLPTGILVIDRDVTLQKRAELATMEARRFAESVTDTVQESLLVLDRDLKVISANQTFYRLFRVRPEETVERYIYEIGSGQWDIPELRTLLEGILPHNTAFEDFEVDHEFAGIGHRTMLLNARRVHRQEQETETILLAIQDITIRREQEQKIQEHQRELASLTEELLLAEERERHRIALVLHDSIGQSLAFSKRELGVLQKKSPANVREGLEYVKEQIDLAVHQTRDLTFELSPTTLHTFGLEAAVEELVEQLAARENLRYHFEATEEDKPLSEQIRTLLYRAARELLMNIIKHAEATNVSIRIDRQDKNVRMVVEDDGRGFDVSQMERTARQQEGFGLFSIRERLTYIGGKFAIESKPGEGTKVTLIAPLNRETLVNSRSGKS